MNRKIYNSRIALLALVLPAGIISTLLHETGHCIFYWLQGVPSAVSLIKAYPLVDITATQHAVSCVGGPLVNILLTIVSYLLIRKHAKHSRGWSILSALIIANAFYFILRSLISVLKNNGGELEYAANLIDLNYYHVVGLFAIVTVMVLILWIKRFRIRASVVNAVTFSLFFIAYFFTIIFVQTVDRSLFWEKFPTVRIDDGRLYNDNSHMHSSGKD
ncbi:hypothetical protein ACFL5K_04410 [Gemmatimonadota bacterium]